MTSLAVTESHFLAGSIIYWLNNPVAAIFLVDSVPFIAHHREVAAGGHSGKLRELDGFPESRLRAPLPDSAKLNPSTILSKKGMRVCRNSYATRTSNVLSKRFVRDMPAIAIVIELPPSILLSDPRSACKKRKALFTDEW